MEKLYLSGAGEMITKISGGAILKFGTIQNLSLATTATFKELFAGKGLFPVVSRAFEKSIEASCDMASFDKDFIEISQGLDTGTITEIDRWLADEEQSVPSGSPYTVTVNKGNYKPGYTYVLDEDGDKMTRVTGTPANANEYQETEPPNGVLTFHSGQAGKKVYISYVYTYDYTANPDNVEALILKADILPKEFELYYRCTLEETGTERGVEIVFWKCKPTTDMKLTFTRDFNIPNFTFRILDPKRPDGRIGHYILL